MVPNPSPLPPANKAPIALESRALQFATRLLPWLAGGLMLAVYGLTLNHWVSTESIGLVANLQGLTLSPGLTAPVTWLLTSPFGWLPPAWVPLAVNLFTAVCAALSLALLARSVALLPHDLSKERVRRQRRRKEPPKLLASSGAWLPPLLAVLVCGLQLSFWQNAITATGEIINLLMFAWVIRCFLEYNTSQKNSWLLWGALVYGMAVANDWAMALFLPVFFAALIWIKQIFLFNERFLKRLIKHPRSFRRQLLWQIPGCWLLGLSVFLLLPAMASLTPAAHLSFWPAVKLAGHTYKASLTHFPRTLLVTSALISVMPIFLIGLRFYQFVAGFNRFNAVIATIFFHLAYVFFLLVCLWTMFDSPLSPRRLGLGMASLPVYFLGALSIGFFIGHFLLISEIRPEPAQRRRKRRSSRTEQRRKQMRLIILWLKRAGLTGVGLVALSVPTGLVCKNLPVIAIKRSDPCGDYIGQLESALPPEGAVLIGNDAFRLAYLQTALIRDDRMMGYLVLNIEALAQSPDYLDFVKRLNPGFNLDFNLPEVTTPDSHRMLPVRLLEELSKTHAIYCLTPVPSSDPVAEFFYFQPHTLLYQLKRYEIDRAFADAPPPELIQENETFWQTFEQHQLPGLVGRISPPTHLPPSGLLNRFLNTLRFWPEADRESQIAGAFYAGALNDWGVDLQKTGTFPAASRCFEAAIELNPLNGAAQINHKFNADYLANRTATMERPLDTARSLNQDYRNWQHVVRDGAVDEPNFCYLLGTVMAETRLYRPAIAQFERVRELSPDRVDTYVSLATLFVECGDFTNALVATDKILALSPANQMGLYLKSSAYIRLKIYDRAIPLLNQLLILNPTNNLVLLNRGEAYRHSDQLAAARQDYATVIRAVTNAYPAYLGLAEIADLETNHAAALTNYELFLKYAPPRMPEVPQAEARLKALQPAAP